MLIRSLFFLVFLSLISCKVKDNPAGNTELTNTSSNLITPKVIVELQPDHTAQELAQEFKEFELEPISISSKTLNAWSFSYNNQKISHHDLIALIKTHAFVVNARGISNKAPKVMNNQAELKKPKSKKATVK